MLKVLAAFLIPDVPEKTQEAMEKDDYRKKCAAEEACWSDVAVFTWKYSVPTMLWP